MASVYASMEDSFQSYVHGDAVQGYLVNYRQKVTTLAELKETDRALSQAKDRISQLQAEVEEKNLQIRKEQEVQRLTNNHVANLEVMIKDLRHEIDELGKLATYLNGHEALCSRPGASWEPGQQSISKGNPQAQDTQLLF